MKPNNTSDSNYGNKPVKIIRYLPQASVSPRTPNLHPINSAPIKKNILLADDEPVIRNLGWNILRRQGYHVFLAQDGQEAVELYKSISLEIDLIIMDLTMPRLSGQEALKKLLIINPFVRVLFTSGIISEQDWAWENKILGFVQKPYRPNDLTQAVQKALGQAPLDR